jgi:hypothetical protein
MPQVLALLQLAIVLVAWVGRRSTLLLGALARGCNRAGLLAQAFPSARAASASAAADGRERVLLTFSSQDRGRVEVESSGGFR